MLLIILSEGIVKEIGLLLPPHGGYAAVVHLFTLCLFVSGMEERISSLNGQLEEATSYNYQLGEHWVP